MALISLDRGKIVARAPDGRPLRMAGTHTDITQRKLTEAALRESEARLRRTAQLLDQTQSAARLGGWESDLRTGVLHWTPETHRLHGTDPATFTAHARGGVCVLHAGEPQAPGLPPSPTPSATAPPTPSRSRLRMRNSAARTCRCAPAAEKETAV